VEVRPVAYGLREDGSGRLWTPSASLWVADDPLDPGLALEDEWSLWSSGYKSLTAAWVKALEFGARLERERDEHMAAMALLADAESLGVAM
jgi:hypothetical protein